MAITQLSIVYTCIPITSWSLQCSICIRILKNPIVAFIDFLLGFIFLACGLLVMVYFSEEIVLAFSAISMAFSLLVWLTLGKIDKLNCAPLEKNAA